MIDFELSEEHIALQQTVREFVAGEVAPYIKEWDEKSHFERSVFDQFRFYGFFVQSYLKQDDINKFFN